MAPPKLLPSDGEDSTFFKSPSKLSTPPLPPMVDEANQEQADAKAAIGKLLPELGAELTGDSTAMKGGSVPPKVISAIRDYVTKIDPQDMTGILAYLAELESGK